MKLIEFKKECTANLRQSYPVLPKGGVLYKTWKYVVLRCKQSEDDVESTHGILIIYLFYNIMNFIVLPAFVVAFPFILLKVPNENAENNNSRCFSILPTSQVLNNWTELARQTMKNIFIL
jgi:hypothetical protein